MTLSLLAESFVEIPRRVLGEQGYKAICLYDIAGVTERMSSKLARCVKLVNDQQAVATLRIVVSGEGHIRKPATTKCELVELSSSEVKRSEVVWGCEGEGNTGL